MLDDTPRHKLMANKLKIEADAGRIRDDWSVKFIEDIHFRIAAGRSLSDKQAAKLGDLFEKY